MSPPIQQALAGGGHGAEEGEERQEGAGMTVGDGAGGPRAEWIKPSAVSSGKF